MELDLVRRMTDLMVRVVEEGDTDRCHLVARLDPWATRRAALIKLWFAPVPFRFAPPIVFVVA